MIKLPNLFGQKKEESQYFLSLIFRNDKIEAYIFQKIGDEVRIVSSQQESFEDSLDNANYEEILEITDRVISQGEDEANIKEEIEKTIFGLKESWVENNKIKRENLDILKKLCEELALKPIGFLTISEAVVGLLQKEEGAPPSAILADIAKNNLTITLVRGGKVIEVKSSEIHQSAAFTVDTLLKHFTNIEILPSRVVLLNEDEDLVQEFIGYQWSKSLPFLHLPQISNLPTGGMGKAFVLGIAKQVGAQVMDEFEVSPAEPSTEIKEIESEQNTKPVEQTQNVEVEKSNIEYVDNDAQEFFGFVQGKDVNKIKPPEPEVVVPSIEEEAVTEEIPEEVKEEVSGQEMLPAGVMLVVPQVKKSLALVLEKIKNLNIKLPDNIPSLPFGKGPTVFVFLGALIFLLILIYYFALLKANVEITVKPNVVEKTEDITFSTDSSDFKNNVIKGNLISVSEDGATSGDATGKKQTGDKAKGTVTIYNLTTNTITYPAQTQITSFSNLNFLTDSTVTVASRSGDASNPNPGKINVNVAAETFGSEYNLPSKDSGTYFTIGKNSKDSIVAKNNNAFSGGTKKEIQVFSKDDAQKLRDDLIKNLEKKAKSDMQNKLQGSEIILPNFVDETLDKENFDKDVDTEAKTVTLKGTATYQGLSYDKNEFIDYLKNILGQNSNIDLKNVELSFDNIKNKNTNEFTTTIKIKAKIFPKLNTAALSKNISGKSFQEAENQILSLPEVDNVRINFSPNLFFFPKTLPKINKNIQITILENG